MIMSTDHYKSECGNKFTSHVAISKKTELVFFSTYLLMFVCFKNKLKAIILSLFISVFLSKYHSAKMNLNVFRYTRILILKHVNNIYNIFSFNRYTKCIEWKLNKRVNWCQSLYYGLSTFHKIVCNNATLMSLVIRVQSSTFQGHKIKRKIIVSAKVTINISSTISLRAFLCISLRSCDKTDFPFV